MASFVSPAIMLGQVNARAIALHGLIRGGHEQVVYERYPGRARLYEATDGRGTVHH